MMFLAVIFEVDEASSALYFITVVYVSPDRRVCLS